VHEDRIHRMEPIYSTPPCPGSLSFDGLEDWAHLDTTPACNGVATSLSPFQGLLQGDEDIAAPNPFQRGQCQDAPWRIHRRGMSMLVWAGTLFQGFVFLWGGFPGRCPGLDWLALLWGFGWVEASSNLPAHNLLTSVATIGDGN
jgi:hypothetical protein